MRKKLTTPLRFAIIEDETHKNIIAFRTNRLILAITLSTTLIVLIGLIVLLIYATPLKHLIPGYPSIESRNTAIANIQKLDSLERELNTWSYQLNNIQRVLAGKTPLNIDSLLQQRDSMIAIPKHVSPSSADSTLRSQVKEEEQFELSENLGNKKIEQIEGMLFFPPLKGVITQEYNKTIGHPFIDIVAPSNTAVLSILDGTIISDGWNDQTGFTIQIQHSNDLISIYKHNAKLLKKTGDKVKAGDAIAIIGDTGTLSTGTHLHFELWYKGEPIDPTLYINF